MWPWIRHWRDWPMRDMWSLHRNGPQPQALHYAYEKAGLTLYDQPIPWNAEGVLVEALLRLPAAVPRRKADFQLSLPGQVLHPDSLRREYTDDRYRLAYRIPLPSRTETAELSWRGRRLGQLTLPYLSRDEFLTNLRLQMPTLFVRLGEQSVACQTFVSTQCKGLMTSAVLTSPTSLAPLMDLGLQVKFRSERGTACQTVPAQLTTSQLAERQALVAIVPRRLPRRIGAWLATWVLAERPLATQRVRAISQSQFQRSLCVVDTRFVIQPAKGKVHLDRQLPSLGEIERAGPCFLVTSREPGMAGVSSFQVRVQMAGGSAAPLHLDQEVLITDGPTMVAPGTLNAADLAQVSSFELHLKHGSIGALSTSPTPAANFTAEGGFKPSADFFWTAAADEELNERLTRLLDEQIPAK